MAIKDNFKDLTTYISSTGFFDKIKITSNSKETILEAMDKDKDVILKGQFSAPVDDLNGEIGLSNLSLLQTITNDPEFQAKESTMEVVYENTADGKVPSELAYTNKSKSHINYRFMPNRLIPDQPKFMEPKWDVVITPTKGSVQQFSWAANGLAAYEQYFIPRIVDGELKFFIGEDSASTQRGGVVFASDIKEKFDSDLKWKIQLVQPVLKIADSCDCEMSFSTKGAIQVKLDTGIGTYKYIFPAKLK
jgi:hypothetical protein